MSNSGGSPTTPTAAPRGHPVPRRVRAPVPPASSARTAASSCSVNRPGSRRVCPSPALVPLGLLRGLALRPRQRVDCQRPLQELALRAVMFQVLLRLADHVARIHPLELAGPPAAPHGGF